MLTAILFSTDTKRFLLAKCHHVNVIVPTKRKTALSYHFQMRQISSQWHSFSYSECGNCSLAKPRVCNFFPYILTCSAKHLVRGIFYLQCVKKHQWTSELIDLSCMNILLNYMYTLHFLVEITCGCNQFATAKAYSISSVLYRN